MEKLKIIPPDAQIYAQVKASWDKIAKPLDGLGPVSYTHLTLPTKA